MSKNIKRAYKYRFYPQKDLVEILAKTFGCVRFIYNKTLDYSQQHYLNKYINNDNINNSSENNNQNKDNIKEKILNPEYKFLSGTDRINYAKTLKDKSEYTWLNEVSSIALQQSIRNLNTAYDRFFKKTSKYPQFKKKLNRNSFTITGKASLHFDKDFLNNKQFFLPKYKKPLNIKWGKGKACRPFNHLAVSSVTISQEPSGKYYISFLVNESIKVKPVINEGNNTKQKVSYDLGIKTTLKMYQGTIYNNIDIDKEKNNSKQFMDFNLPELIKEIDKKLRKQQRILSRKEKRSKNRNKQRIKVAKLYERKNNILTDYYQKLSSKIINENQVIIREDLGVKNMLKNRKLSRSIHGVAWSRFNEMINYKAKWHNREVITVNRFYPSSKTCSSCGHIYKELKLSERQWTCSVCNAHHDRDENACLNLYHYQQNNNKAKTIKNNVNNKSKTAVGTTVAACGGNIRPKVSKKSKAVSNEAGILCL